MAWRPSPIAVVFFVSFINLVNYVDRGVISGAPTQFNAFILRTLHVEQQGVWFGLLTSAFIGAYSAGCIAFGHLLNFYPPFRLLGIGMSLWVLTLMLSGSAMWLGDHPRSYWFLVLCRALSGVGEASFQCIIPPYIEDFAPAESKSLWLSIFFTAIPVGQVPAPHRAPITPSPPAATPSQPPPRPPPLPTPASASSESVLNSLRALRPSAPSHPFRRPACPLVAAPPPHPVAPLPRRSASSTERTSPPPRSAGGAPISSRRSWSRPVPSPPSGCPRRSACACGQRPPRRRMRRRLPRLGIAARTAWTARRA